VDFSQVLPIGASARFVAFSNLTSFGSDYGFVGLSEVQFTASASAFARVGPGTFTSLRSGEVRAVPYSFTPTHAGPFTQAVTFVSDGGTVTVNLHGVGGWQQLQRRLQPQRVRELPGLLRLPDSVLRRVLGRKSNVGCHYSRPATRIRVHEGLAAASSASGNQARSAMVR